VEPAEEGEVEPDEDIPFDKRQKTIDSMDLSCPKNLEKNMDVICA